MCLSLKIERSWLSHGTKRVSARIRNSNTTHETNQPYLLDRCTDDLVTSIHRRAGGRDDRRRGGVFVHSSLRTKREGESL